MIVVGFVERTGQGRLSIVRTNSDPSYLISSKLFGKPVPWIVKTSPPSYFNEEAGVVEVIVSGT